MATQFLDRRSVSPGYLELLKRMRWDRLLVIPASLALWIAAIYAVRFIVGAF